MTKDDKATPQGFAGLEDMVSDLDAPIQPKSPTPPPKAANPPPFQGARLPTHAAPELLNLTATRGVLPPTPPPRAVFIGNDQTPSSKAKGPSNEKMLGIAAVMLIAVAIVFNASQKKSRPVAASGVPQVSRPTTQPAPDATATAPALTPAAAPAPKYFYKLRASDGAVIEVEGPPKATDAQLHQIALLHWLPKETYHREDRPSGGYGQVLDDDQIRYCLSQKIRLGGWEKTVDSYSGYSVDSFNREVKEFNSRCGNYKYRKGAVERVQADVDTRFFELEKDGRAHKGPRMPAPAKFTRISVRVVGPAPVQGAGKVKPLPVVANATPASFNVQRHPQCAGSYEVEKCEKLARQMDQETTQQKQARQQKLDAERQRNMAEVNGTR